MKTVIGIEVGFNVMFFRVNKKTAGILNLPCQHEEYEEGGTSLGYVHLPKYNFEAIGPHGKVVKK